jgi:ketosteroid isomerase-like protein
MVTPICPQSPQAALECFETAFNRRQLTEMLALYESDASLALVDGPPVSGHAAIARAIAPFMARGLTLLLRPSTIIETEHGLALAISDWTAHGEADGGERLRLFGTSHVVMRRQRNGGWRYLIDDPGFAHAAPD